MKNYYDNMFYNCSSLISLNLINFNSLTKSSTKVLENINPNLIYFIDENKDYIFLEELLNYTKNFTDICINYNSKNIV